MIRRRGMDADAEATDILVNGAPGAIFLRLARRIANDWVVRRMFIEMTVEEAIVFHTKLGVAIDAAHMAGGAEPASIPLRISSDGTEQ